MNGRMWPALGVAIGIAVIGGLMYFAFAPVDDRASDGSKVSKRVEKRDGKARRGGLLNERKPSVAKRAATAGAAKRERRKTSMKVVEDWFAKLPNAKDRGIAKHIQDAQDADDRDGVFKAAEEALSSDSVEVRQAAVDALSLYGEEAIPGLLQFVGDKDKNVADSACHAWDDAVDAIDGDLNKLPVIKSALGVMKDKEHVATAVGKIEMFDQSRAIRELAKLARDGGVAASAAKESYENLTGDKFENWAAAELKAMAIDRDNQDSE